MILPFREHECQSAGPPPPPPPSFAHSAQSGCKDPGAQVHSKVHFPIWPWVLPQFSSCWFLPHVQSSPCPSHPQPTSAHLPPPANTIKCDGSNLSRELSLGPLLWTKSYFLFLLLKQGWGWEFRTLMIPLPAWTLCHQVQSPNSDLQENRAPIPALTAKEFPSFVLTSSLRSGPYSIIPATPIWSSERGRG